MAHSDDVNFTHKLQTKCFKQQSKMLLLAVNTTMEFSYTSTFQAVSIHNPNYYVTSSCVVRYHHVSWYTSSIHTLPKSFHFALNWSRQVVTNTVNLTLRPTGNI